MRVQSAVCLLALSFLSTVHGVHAETGEEGWLRYAPLPTRATQQYKAIPHRIVVTSQSAVVHSAANELARGLHSMLGENLQIASTLPAEDAFILGTPAEIRQLVPDWKPPSTIAGEGFSLAKFAVQGHNDWVLAGATDRGELYGGFSGHTQPPGGLPNWYRDNVTGGPGSFLLVVNDFESFGEAMTNKLLNEVAGLHPTGVLALRAPMQSALP